MWADTGQRFPEDESVQKRHKLGIGLQVSLTKERTMYEVNDFPISHKILNAGIRKQSSAYHLREDKDERGTLKRAAQTLG